MRSPWHLASIAGYTAGGLVLTLTIAAFAAVVPRYPRKPGDVRFWGTGSDRHFDGAAEMRWDMAGRTFTIWTLSRKRLSARESSSAALDSQLLAWVPPAESPARTSAEIAAYLDRGEIGETWLSYVKPDEIESSPPPRETAALFKDDKSSLWAAVIKDRVGWPLRCAESTTHYSILTLNKPYLEIATDGLAVSDDAEFVAATRNEPGVIMATWRVLPLKVSWIPAATCAAIYAVALWLVRRLWIFARAETRVMRRTCAHCGHSCAPSTSSDIRPCPECGIVTPHKWTQRLAIAVVGIKRPG
jgi:predicted RNA-binding Zn-ribbon protein involved in translation (DUF1610 family)